MNEKQALQLISLLESIVEITKAQKIVNTFIKAFKTKGILHSDGLYYLHGNFRIGGTVSGRISSNSPNLMNLPSGSVYGKIVKSCFISPPGMLFMGADYSSLEAMIDALLTKDPNKMAVYINGMDSHAFNSFSYWPEKMVNIQNALTRANKASKLYKIIHDSGEITYHTDDEKIIKELL